MDDELPKLVLVSMSDEDMIEIVESIYAEFDRREIPAPVALPVIAYLVGDFMRSRLNLRDEDLPDALEQFTKMMVGFSAALLDKPREPERKLQ